MAFRGTYDHSLDAKNRLTVPARMRAQLAEGVVLTKGVERCVQAWPPAAFDAFVADALQGAPRLSERYRKIQRFFNANSDDQELDSAGRVTIAAKLREHAGLTKDCVVVGRGECVEIWDRETWQAESRQLDDSVEDIAALFES